MASCDLCDLRTPDPPITAEGVEGAFCCRGCLAVAEQLGSVEEADAETARDVLDTGAEDAGAEGAETAFLSVEGMHCATCEAFIESRALDREGIVDAEASYASEVVKLAYDPDRIDREDLPGVVDGLGYTAREVDERPEGGADPPWRLLVGAFLAMPFMLWYLVFIYPRYLGVAPASPAWTGATGTGSLANLWAIATVVLGYTGYPILRGAYVSLRAGRPNMDLLVALAAVNAYAYSALVVLTGGSDVYFDITVVIVLVVTFGKHYEGRIKRRAAGMLADTAEEGVDSARRRTPEGAEVVGVEALRPGDEVVVRPGERVPVDGTVIEGEAAIDESLLTGESVPVRKEEGEEVIGGSVVADGAVVIEVPEDATSTVDRLTRVLWEVQSARPGAQRLADRIAAVFVPLVLVVAAGAFAWRALGGAPFADALLVGLSVLVVSCPCALGLATPLAVASGIREGLTRGVVVASAATFEAAAGVDVVAFDKTGTLTTGEMWVIEPGTERAMELAAAVEAFSEHPIAEAITAHTAPPEYGVEGFERHPGRGVSARVDGVPVVVGTPEFLAERGLPIPEALDARAERVRSEGNVPVVVGWEGRARSVVAVGDEPREGWEEVLSALAARGHEIAVVTGDSEAAASRFRDHPDVEYVFAGVPPDAKAEVVARLREEGSVAMVGDGTNDAPALAAADLGIAMGEATAAATDAADAVVTRGGLEGVLSVFDTVSGTKRRIRENLGWAFVYNAVAIPVAAAGLLNPLVAAVAMAASSLLVVGNSARPLADRVSSAGAERKRAREHLRSRS